MHGNKVWNIWPKQLRGLGHSSEEFEEHERKFNQAVKKYLELIEKDSLPFMEFIINNDVREISMDGPDINKRIRSVMVERTLSDNSERTIFLNFGGNNKLANIILSSKKIIDVYRYVRVYNVKKKIKREITGSAELNINEDIIIVHNKVGEFSISISKL